MYTNVLTNLLLLTVSCLPVKGNGNRSALEFCAVLKLIVEDIAVYAIKIFAILFFFNLGPILRVLFSLLYFATSAEIEIKFLILVSCFIVYSILRF